MDAAGLRAMQAPIKERYKTDPQAAYITLRAKGTLFRGRFTATRDAAGLSRAKHLDGSVSWAIEADYSAKKDGLSRPGAADDPQNLAAINIKVEVVVDNLWSEAVYEASNADDDFVLVRHAKCPAPKT